jgi:uncharacterized protein
MSRRRSSGDDGLLGLFEESGRNVERTGTLLRELMVEYPERSALARDILICEQEGDRIAHDIIHRLSSNGTKLERGDAYELARALDDVVDHAEETADSLELYSVEAPMVQAEELAGAAAAVRVALSQLRQGDDISAQLVEIHRLVRDGVVLGPPSCLVPRRAVQGRTARLDGGRWRPAGPLIAAVNAGSTAACQFHRCRQRPSQTVTRRDLRHSDASGYSPLTSARGGASVSIRARCGVSPQLALSNPIVSSGLRTFGCAARCSTAPAPATGAATFRARAPATVPKFR